MRVEIFHDKTALAARAAADGLQLLRAALAARGQANVTVATGTSQFEVLAALARAEQVAWERVTFFHLDEYIGLPLRHPASFRRYLWERFVTKLPLPPRAFHFIDGNGDPQAECERLGELIARHPMDVTFLGIGENGHLAFNDPPADFQTERAFLVVTLEEACRRQQVGEGWFVRQEEVPTQAITMSMRQIMKSAAIICVAPDRRKAEAVRAAVQGPVTPQLPASLLQRHPAATLYLDRDSASLLGKNPP